jgi:hypothetical protein
VFQATGDSGLFRFSGTAYQAGEPATEDKLSPLPLSGAFVGERVFFHKSVGAGIRVIMQGGTACLYSTEQSGSGSRSNPAPGHARNRHPITLESGSGSRSKAAPPDGVKRHRLRDLGLSWQASNRE